MSFKAWDPSIDSVVPYNSDSKQNTQMAEFNVDWEETYLLTEEAKQKASTQPTNNNIESQQHLKEELARLVIQEQEEMDRVDEILAALSRIEQNTQQQYSAPSVNTYVPHYTKPWTKSELAKVGAYSTKPSEAQKVYSQVAAKQDRAWAASMKNELKWKK